MKTMTYSLRMTTESRLRGGTLPAFVALCLAAAFSSAQTPVVQDGRLFDANPQVGGDRYNYQQSRPVSPLLGGNLIASGNVGYGFALRSYSPIESPTAFRAGLGSGALSGFTRDSVSVGDAYSPGGGLTPRVYFDPSRTAPTGAFLQGYYGQQSPAFSPAVGGPARSSNGAMNPWGGSVYGGPPQPAASSMQFPNPGASYGASNRLNPELSSTIFGVQPIRLPDPISGRGTLEQPTYIPQGLAEHDEAESSDSSAGAVGGPLDMRLWVSQGVSQPRSHLSVFAQDDAASILGRDPLTPGMEIPTPTEAPAIATPAGAAPPGPTTLPGSDVFTDMQLALELSQDPSAQWFDEMLKASANADDPAQTPALEAAAPEAAAEFISRVLASPVKTFVGQGDAPVNAALREAEADLHDGRYRDAMRAYERANRLDPANPLPLLGKGHAALAAGEYMTAAASLIAGLDRFQNIARFDVDLKSLIGGGEIVDIRRADLMKLLASHDDPNLRFLLGYLEYHTGMTESGLNNLNEAARKSKPGDLIRRYPEILRQNSANAAATGESE